MSIIAFQITIFLYCNLNAIDNNRPDNLVTILNSECKRTLDNLAIYIRKAQAIHQRVAEAWLELEMNELVDLRIIVT